MRGLSLEALEESKVGLQEYPTGRDQNAILKDVLPFKGRCQRRELERKLWKDEHWHECGCHVKEEQEPDPAEEDVEEKPKTDYTL